MDFGVIHEISDYEGWQNPDNGGHELPRECENPVYVLATERNRAMCIWHAPSAEVLQTALDQHFPHGVVNHVFPIDVEKMPTAADGSLAVTIGRRQRPTATNREARPA